MIEELLSIASATMLPLSSGMLSLTAAVASTLIVEKHLKALKKNVENRSDIQKLENFEALDNATKLELLEKLSDEEKLELIEKFDEEQITSPEKDKNS